jgi:hypothetical protein
MVLENRIIQRRRKDGQTGDSATTILRAPIMAQKGAEDGSWVEVSSTVNESSFSDGVVNLPDGDSGDKALGVFEACQKSVLTTLSDLMCNAMRTGGSEASTLLWKSVLITLSELEHSSANTVQENSGNNVLCRILAMVLMKCLKRDYQWELWTLSLSSAISRLCLLIEEKDLLLFPLGESKQYSSDQILLVCALVNVLSYGRDTTGWCQLILPTPPGPTSEEDNARGNHGSDSAAAAAKVMLPVLQPVLRVMVECIGNLSSNIRILVPDGNSTKALENQHSTILLEYVSEELRHTLMAAIVGMAFANARDVALHAMSSLRRALQTYKNSNDTKGIDVCTSLACMTAEELRVRYEGERRRRETALFDAYEDQDELKRRSSQEAAADSQAIENLILGGSIVPDHSKEFAEEVSFENDSSEQEERTLPKSGDDFVLDLSASVGAAAANKAKMDWRQYEGLGAALEKCYENGNTPIDHESKDLRESAGVMLENLAPFLDSWDQNAAIDVAETELVKLFDFSLDDDSRSPGALSKEDSGSKESESYRLKGPGTAADAMTTFIELAAAENSRMMEVSGLFLPNHRYSCVSFAERFCWARYMEITREGSLNKSWERGVADGNRDIRSRLVTIPCSPQFKRFIPKYLDHSSESRNDRAAKRTADSALNESGEASNIDEFTKTLMQKGHLEIVDITKKQIKEDEEPALALPNSDALDDFDESPMEVPSNVSDTASEEDKESSSTASTEGTSTAAESMGKVEEESEAFDKSKIGSSHFSITASAFACPPDNSSSTLSLMHSAAAGLIERHVENCLHVKAEGSRRCSMLLTATHLILEYEADSDGLFEGELLAVREEAERQRMIEESGGGNTVDEDKIQEEMEKRQKEIAALRPKSIRWNLSELSHVYLRRYRLRDSSLELFFIPSGGTSFGGYGLYSPSTSLFIDFGPGYEGVSRRDDAGFAIMKRAPPQAIKQWPDRAAQFLHEQLSRLTIGWVEGRITNFDYLLHLNMLAGRSYNDTCQYPVMPWVLSNYKSEEIPDLTDPKNFRDLTKPMGALNPDRLEDFIERFNTFADPSIPPFMYGSHYSTNAGVVLHFLVRMHPFAGLHRQLQGGHFDVADRLFSSVPRTWEMCTGSSAAEVKELTPEWYCNPAFLKNSNNFKLGTSQDGDLLGDVTLPPWAKGSPEKFIEVMRNALESDICSSMLPDWIDLIFGRKQQGKSHVCILLIDPCSCGFMLTGTLNFCICRP